MERGAGMGALVGAFHLVEQPADVGSEIFSLRKGPHGNWWKGRTTARRLMIAQKPHAGPIGRGP